MAFCATFTIGTQSVGYPTFASICGPGPSRFSSACSCYSTPTLTTTTGVATSDTVTIPVTTTVTPSITDTTTHTTPVGTATLTAPTAIVTDTETAPTLVSTAATGEIETAETSAPSSNIATTTEGTSVTTSIEIAPTSVNAIITETTVSTGGTDTTGSPATSSGVSTTAETTGTTTITDIATVTTRETDPANYPATTPSVSPTTDVAPTSVDTAVTGTTALVTALTLTDIIPAPTGLSPSSCTSDFNSLLENGGFDCGVLAPWKYSGKDLKGGVIVPGYQGPNACKIGLDSGDGKISQVVTLISGGLYKLLFWQKTTLLEKPFPPPIFTACALSVAVAGKKPFYPLMTSKPFAEDSWMPVSTKFLAPKEGGSAEIGLTCSLKSGKMEVLLDSIVLVQEK
ncbi:MAG: hypothetical protein M1814_005358 [Vezdaea aestivalis]|nr:MAG: hypothetical protein M1814_005358 [Vezdaea aestivalis]